MKILHILSDDKFIDKHVARFSQLGESNHFVYLKETFTYKGDNKSNLSFIKPFSEAFYRLIDVSSTYSKVIIYGLDYPKAYFVNHINRNIIVVWHFYGAEIYNTYSVFRRNLFEPLTRKMLSNNIEKLKKIKVLALSFIYGVKALIRFQTLPLQEQSKAFSRINYFAWYIEEEFRFIRSNFLNFPKFLYLPPATKVPLFEIINKENTLILGNSGAPANNHMDILTSISGKYDGKVIIPFNYGGGKSYRAQLKRDSVTLDLDISFVEDLMTYEQYVKFIIGSSALVLNSNRQMALGNIFIALCNGVTIYLREENPVSKWLKDNGFHFFDIDTDLHVNIEARSIVLENDQLLENRNLYLSISNERNNQRFIDGLKNL